MPNHSLAQECFYPQGGFEGALVEPTRIQAPSLNTSDLIRRDFTSRKRWGGETKTVEQCGLEGGKHAMKACGITVYST